MQPTGCVAEAGHGKADAMMDTLTEEDLQLGRAVSALALLGGEGGGGGGASMAEVGGRNLARGLAGRGVDGSRRPKTQCSSSREGTRSRDEVAQDRVLASSPAFRRRTSLTWTACRRRCRLSRRHRPRSS